MTATCTAPLVTPEFPSKLIVNIIKQTIQTENCSLWRLPRLGDAPFGASPRPAFTICGWRYTANHTARPITPEFPSKLIVNIIKQTIQTENCSLWRLPRLGDAPFGASPRPAFTICGFQLELDTLQSIPPRRFTTYLAGSGRPTRGAHRLSRCLLALCSSHLGRCRPYLQKNWCVANLNAPLWYAARMWIPPIKR